MSYQNSKGTWVIPADQAKEFLTKHINYNELIRECMKGHQPKSAGIIVNQSARKSTKWNRR